MVTISGSSTAEICPVRGNILSSAPAMVSAIFLAAFSGLNLRPNDFVRFLKTLTWIFRF